jgi:hypothetical protein
VHCSPGSNILKLEFYVLLPKHSNGASLDGEIIQCGSVPLPVAPDNKDFMPNILFEGIQADIAYFCHESDWYADLSQVRYIQIEVNDTHEGGVTVRYQSQATV